LNVNKQRPIFIYQPYPHTKKTKQMSTTSRRLRVPRQGFKEVAGMGSDNPFLKRGHKTFMQVDSRVHTALWAPFNCYKFEWGNVLYAVVMELVFSILLGWFVNLAKTAATGASLLLDGAVVGAVSALVYYLAWTWTTDMHLKRHLNWVITVAYIFAGQVGILPALGYIGIQFGGAAIAGAILSGLGAASVPLPTLSTGAVFGLEFLGATIIALAVIHTDTLEEVEEKQNVDDRSSARETEQENRARVGSALATSVFLLTAIFYQYQLYSFGNTVYFAGGVGTGDWNPGATPFNDTAIFLGAGLVGAVAAGVVSLLASLAVVWTRDPNVRWVDEAPCDPENKRRMYPVMERGLDVSAAVGVH
jgi:hypothetical protein